MIPTQKPAAYNRAETMDLPVERRSGTDSWRADITVRMEAVENGMTENTRLTGQVKSGLDNLTDDMSGLLKFSAILDTTGSVWQWIGDQAWTLAKIAGCCGVLWAVFKFAIQQAK